MNPMGKVVLITGAAHGLGHALAQKYLSENWCVIATDNDDLSMAGLLVHENAMVINMDVTSDVSVGNAFRRIRDEHVILDLIINNAGIDRYFPLSEAPVEQFKQVFEVNVFGAYRVNQEFLPIVRQPGGRIVHISSESLNLTVPFMPYPLTKRLVEGYARVLRTELRYRGIDVTIVRPGAIRTTLLETVASVSTSEATWKLEKQFRKFAAMAPGEIGRVITPEKAADYVFYVAGVPHPAPVYRINNMLRLRMAAWLPFRWIEKLIYRKLA